MQNFKDFPLFWVFIISNILIFTCWAGLWMHDLNVWAFRTPVRFFWNKDTISRKRCLWHCLTTADIIAEITGTQEEELEVTDADGKEEDKLTRPIAEQVHSAIIVLESKTSVCFLNLEKKLWHPWRIWIAKSKNIMILLINKKFSPIFLMQCIMLDFWTNPLYARIYDKYTVFTQLVHK